MSCPHTSSRMPMTRLMTPIIFRIKFRLVRCVYIFNLPSCPVVVVRGKLSRYLRYHRVLLPTEKFLGFDDLKNRRRNQLTQAFVAGVDFGEDFAGINFTRVGVT